MYMVPTVFFSLNASPVWPIVERCLSGWAQLGLGQ